MIKSSGPEVLNLGHFALEDEEDAGCSDDSWEYTEQRKPERPRPASSDRSVKVKSTPRRQMRTVSHTPVARQFSSARKLPSQKIPPSQFPRLTRQERGKAISRYLCPILRYFIHIVVDAFKLHRPLFSFALMMIMAYMVFKPLISVTQSLISPLCHVPILNNVVPFCLWHFEQEGIQTASWTKLTDMQGSSFEQLLDASVGGSALALEVKKAQMATSDLIMLVRVSDLRSKETMARILVNFVDEAKKTGRGLQSLSSRVNGAVDTILAVNEYALNTIEAASMPVPVLSRVLAPFSRSPSLSKPTKAAVKDTFLMAMESLSNVMERLVLEAEASHASLERLEYILSSLHEIVLREDTSIQLSKSEVLSELWTKLGGNNRKLQGIDRHSFLLKGVGGYRNRALVHVVSTLQTLGALAADMDELRSRVAAPDIVQDKVPVEVHMSSIKVGLERLKEGQVRARKREEEMTQRVLEIGVLAG